MLLSRPAIHHVSNRSEHPFRQFREARRRSPVGGRRRRRHHSFRRDGQSLRSQSHHRADGLRGHPAADQGGHRRASDGQAGRPHRSRFRQGRRQHHQFPSGSLGACGPHHRADQGIGLQGRAGVQSGHAAVLARPHARQARSGADHVGQSRVRRPEIHPRRAGQTARVRERIEESGREIWLEVDGGVKVDNIAEIARAGADTFVAGSAIFGTKDYKATIAAMRCRTCEGLVTTRHRDAEENGKNRMMRCDDPPVSQRQFSCRSSLSCVICGESLRFPTAMRRSRSTWTARWSIRCRILHEAANRMLGRTRIRAGSRESAVRAYIGDGVDRLVKSLLTGAGWRARCGAVRPGTRNAFATSLLPSADARIPALSRRDGRP